VVFGKICGKIFGEKLLGKLAAEKTKERGLTPL
jgi:hypothetical protein